MFSKGKNLTFFGSAFFIFCIALSFFQIFFPPTSEISTLVYCPLQKTWVKSAEHIKPKIEKTLDNICTSETLKNLANFKISLKTLQPADEKTFFDYLEKGDRAFSELNRFPDLPSRKSFTKSKSEIAINNFNQKIEKSTLHHFSFAQFQRPPNVSVAINFDFQITRDLEKISRSINPRSPPFFI